MDKRERAGLTQQGLADLCGLSRSQIARWECGENRPTVEGLEALVTGLARKIDGFTLDDLLDAEAAA